MCKLIWQLIGDGMGVLRVRSAVVGLALAYKLGGYVFVLDHDMLFHKSHVKV